jgi:hypothetical protein
MWHRSRLTDAIEIRAGEASRTIAPGQRVDLAAEILPGVPLAQVVKLEWFEPEIDDSGAGHSGDFQDFGAETPVTLHGIEADHEADQDGNR